MRNRKRGRVVTFLRNQTLPPSGQSDHDDAYPRVLGLDTITVSLSAWFYELALGHSAHIGDKDAIGIGHGRQWRASARGHRDEVKMRVEKIVRLGKSKEIWLGMQPAVFRGAAAAVRDWRRVQSRAIWWLRDYYPRGRSIERVLSGGRGDGWWVQGRLEVVLQAEHLARLW